MSTAKETPRSLPQDPHDLSGGTAEVVAFERLSSQRRPKYGTVTRYRMVTSDDVEREVVYGQALSRRRSPTRSADLTIGTAPPLSMAIEGMVMHFLLKTLEMGVDGLVFGPERARTDRTVSEEEGRAVAERLTLTGSARAAHQASDLIAAEHDADLRHMLWVGISLGSLKGLLYSATAPDWNRQTVYGHFVAPVCPNPIEPPDEDEYRKFVRSEMGAMVRMARELMWKDVRDRTFRIHEDVTRLMRPGLITRYARSFQRGTVQRAFTAAWRTQVASGIAGTAASRLPLDTLATFELFSRDEGSPIDEWRDKLEAQLAADRSRIVVQRGRHSDAARLSFQKQRARAIKRVITAVESGTPIDELRHPLDG